MSDSDQLGAIAEQLTATLVGSYGGGSTSSTSLAFLPGDLPVPSGIVQQGQVNVTQLAAWLRSGFDNPLLISPATATIDSVSSRNASDIYAEVVQWAKPLAQMHSDAWQRIAGEISAAQDAYGPPGGDKPIVCQPDDWPLPERTEYWTVFDSTVSPTGQEDGEPGQEDGVPGQEDGQPGPDSAAPSPDSTTADALPKVDTTLWQLRGDSNAETSPAGDPAPEADQTPPEQTADAPDDTTAVADLTASDSMPMSLHLEHTCVTLQRILGGRSWWNGVFLSDNGWYVPGLVKGALVPPPPQDTNAMAPDLGLKVYAIPAALIVVRNLSVVANWSPDAENALSAPSSAIGPLSLAGAQASPGTDGTKSYTHAGMQVVAALCAPLPVLPPADPPAASPS
ncbi:hypothetical protein [Streptomyces sp. NPDC049585]|uniref:hypothetical protein n=1 Tax=Streptomyces sp. NPDC049585 TaxID=3155154 RepID=UPI003433932E